MNFFLIDLAAMKNRTLCRVFPDLTAKNFGQGKLFRKHSGAER
jgi:hypothetical protein